MSIYFMIEKYIASPFMKIFQYQNDKHGTTYLGSILISDLKITKHESFYHVEDNDRVDLFCDAYKIMQEKEDGSKVVAEEGDVYFLNTIG